MAHHAEELVEPLLALLAQQRGAFLDQVLLELRHAFGGRAGARREGEDVQIGEAAVIDDLQRVREHLVRLGREAGDDVGAEDDAGAPRAQFRAECDRVFARMAALHALQNHVVARLQRQVNVRHHPLLARDHVHQFGVSLDRVDGRQPQALQLRYGLQNSVREIAQLRSAFEVRSP